MKRLLRLIILLVVVAAAVVLLVLTRGVGDEVETTPSVAAADSSEPPRNVILDLDKDQIERVVIDGPQGALTLVRDGDAFVVDYPEEVAWNDDAVERVPDVFLYARDEFAIEEPEDLDQYGLSEPRLTATAHLVDGGSTTLRVGGKNPGATRYYVQVDDDPSVHVMFTYAIDRLFTTADALRDRSLPSVNREAVVRFELESPTRTLEVRPRPESDVIDPFGGQELVSNLLSRPYTTSSDKTMEFVQALPQFSIASFVEEDADDPARYGLVPPYRRLLLVDQQENSFEIAFGAETENGETYAMLLGTDQTNRVFTVDADLSFFDASHFEMMSKFALIINIDEVDSARWQGAEGSDYVLRIEREFPEPTEEEPEPDAIETYFVGSEEVPEDEAKQIYQKMIGLTADAIRPEGEGRSLPATDPLLTITYQLNGSTQDGDNPRTSAAVSFYPYNDDYRLIVRDGVADLLISRVQLDRAVAGIESELEKARTGGDDD